MFKRIHTPGALGLLVIVCLAFVLSFAISYGWALQNPNFFQTALSASPPVSDRDHDGLIGPVNSVRTETAKLSVKAGETIEGPRELLETTTYDLKGKRIDSSYYLVSSRPHAGKEEYAHNHQGDVIEMTVRGDNNSILSKEVYTYEYDSVGNWTKMLTSTLVYEGDKVTSQPTEVAYRKVTYYFDQSMAEMVKPSTPASNTLPSAQPNQGDLASLRSALDGWVAATNERDLDKLMNFYGAQLEAFYRARDVSHEFVRADKSRLFERADAIKVSIETPEITVGSDDSAVTMRFRKEYVMKVKGRQRRGRVIHQLGWQRTAEGWKIVSERDLRVLR